MNSLIKEGEQLIQAYSNPKVYQLYQFHKRKILFGPFADIINNFQSDNQEITKKICEMSSKKVEPNLRTYVKKTFAEILNVQLNAGYENKSFSLNEIANVLYDTIMSNEKQLRAEIQRYKNNITKYENKIQESKTVTVKKSTPPHDNRNQLAQKLRKLQNQVKVMKMNYTNMLKENEQFTQKLAHAQRNVSKKQKDIQQRKAKVKEFIGKNNELVQYKADINAELSEMIEKVQKTILLQRFGPEILTKERSPKIQQIIQLKQEIQKLKEEKEQMEAQKKEKLIESIKEYQKTYILQQISQYV